MSYSRRSFLLTVPGFCFAAKNSSYPTAPHRYEDAATDLPVVRLTDPAQSSFLPGPASRPVARRGGFLLYLSDASGRMQVHRLDLKKPESRQLTDSGGVSAFALMPDERSFCYVDSRGLSVAPLSSLVTREVYRFADGVEATRHMCVSIDGLYAALVERQGPEHRLQLVQLRTGAVTPLAQASEELAAPIPRPKRASVLYRRGDGLWLANYDGKQDYRLRLGEGKPMSAQWSPDGRTVLYLDVPATAGKLHTIREFTPDSNQDRAISETTQFLNFDRNPDASMLAGASASKASPYVLLLARAVKREFTLCEHRASDPAMVQPVFSSNSQQVYFTSDLHGKPAIYQVQVDKLVEETKEP